MEGSSDLSVHALLAYADALGDLVEDFAASEVATSEEIDCDLSRFRDFQREYGKCLGELEDAAPTWPPVEMLTDAGLDELFPPDRDPGPPIPGNWQGRTPAPTLADLSEYWRVQRRDASVHSLVLRLPLASRNWRLQQLHALQAIGRKRQ